MAVSCHYPHDKLTSRYGALRIRKNSQRHQAAPHQLEVFDQVALRRHTRNIAVGLERISMWVSELIQTVLPIKPADAVAH